MQRFTSLVRREKHVMLKGQPRRFRLIKWIVILTVLSLLTLWKGVGVAAIVFAACCFLGICLHFLLRSKTSGWTKSWGPYKRIVLDGQ